MTQSRPATTQLSSIRRDTKSYEMIIALFDLTITHATGYTADSCFHGTTFICFFATKWEAQRYDTKTEHNENIDYRQRVTWSRPVASTQRRASGRACPAPQQQDPAAFTAYQHCPHCYDDPRMRIWDWLCSRTGMRRHESMVVV